MTGPTKELLNILNSIDDSIQFCASGDLSPVLPGLSVPGVGDIGLPITAATAKQLIKQASQAPYGRGEETIVDINVRRVWQLEPAQFSINNSKWESILQEAVDAVKNEFAIKGGVYCELYKMLIYEKGSFFSSHRDSEKTDGMFATLVVCLPSNHQGGQLHVSHDGKTQVINFADETSEYEIHFAAFYTDCRHEIKPVTKGYRICLVYNLSLAKSKRQPAAPQHRRHIDALKTSLQNVFADESRNRIAIPLKHEYTEAGLNLAALKGGDRAIAALLLQAAKSLKYQAYVCLMEFYQTGTPDYSTMSYNRWGYDEVDDEAEMEEVLDESLTLDHWIDANGRKKQFGKMTLEPDEFVSTERLEDLPFRQEVHEATGNAGATVERWYRQAVIVLWPQDRHFRIMAGEGQTAAIPALQDLIAKTKAPSADDDCRTFAREIIDNWSSSRHYYGSRESSHSTEMLKLLERIADSDLVVRFITNVLIKNYDGTEGELLARIGSKLGWDHFAVPLVAFVAAQDPTNPTAQLEATVSVFRGLCCDGGKMTAPRKKVCAAAATELECIIEKWDAEKERDAWYRREEHRTGIIEPLMRAFSAIGESEPMDRILSHAFGDKKHYDLHKVLIPAAKDVARWITTKSTVLSCYKTLVDHCIRELESATEKPVTPPPDWKRDSKMSCKCDDCSGLQKFLRDPNEQVYRFKANQQYRKHVEQKIQQDKLDLDCKTDRKGSPQTLVCTKNQASYERRKKQFGIDVELLKELREMPVGKNGKGRSRRTKKATTKQAPQ